MFKIFDKIKDVLGIEGLRVDILTDEQVSKRDEAIEGQLLFHTKSDKIIQTITLNLIEKYKRGRKEEQMIDEYTLSTLTLDVNVKVTEEQPAKLDFSLPINLLQSEMDRLADKNFIAKNLVRVAKKIKQVQSDYRLEAIVEVEGSPLNTVSKRPIILKK
jgi:hypothetical protein